MQKQFKHIVILFMEFIHIQQSRADDTKGSQDNRKNAFYNQLKTLMNWIFKFDSDELFNKIKNNSLNMHSSLQLD